MSLQDCIKIIKPYIDEKGLKTLEANPYSFGKTRLKMLEGQHDSVVDLIVDEIVDNAISGKSTRLIKQSRIYNERKTKTVEFAQAANLEMDAVERELFDTTVSIWDSFSDYFKNRKEGWADKKVDTTVIQRLLSVPSHYFRDVYGLGRVFFHTQQRETAKENLFNDIISTTDGENLVKRGLTFQKERKAEYKKVKRYLKHNDQNEIGYHIEHKEGDWVVYDPKGKEVKRFLKEDRAVSEMIIREHKDLLDAGFSMQAADAVAGFRRMTNNGFDSLMEDYRNLEKIYKAAGKPLPLVKTYVDGEIKKVDLKVALAIMGNKRGYYMPRIRKPGRFSLHAEKAGAHPRLEFFDSKILLNKRYNTLNRQGYKVTRDTDRKIPEDTFSLPGSIIKTQEIINEALENAHNSLKEGGDFSKQFDDITKIVEEEFASALAEQVANIHKGRGFRSHMISRSDAKGIDVYEGYEEDPIIAIGKYARSIAGGKTKADMSLNMLKAFLGMEESWTEYKARVESEGETATREDYLKQVDEQRVDPAQQKNAHRDGLEFMEDVLRNDEFMDRAMGIVKGLAALKYLALRLPAGVVNLTAMATSAPATISKYTDISLTKSFKFIGKASKDYYEYKFGDRKKVDKYNQKMFAAIENNGWAKPRFNMETMTALQSKFGGKWSTFMEFAMANFAVTEHYNRTATIAAAYMAERSKDSNWTDAKHEKALETAKYASDQAHAIYGKENYPDLARGTGITQQAFKSFYVFKNFSHNYLLTMKDMGLSKQTAFMAIAPAVLSGLGAATFAQPVFWLIEALGLGDDPEEALYSVVENALDEASAEWLRFGLFGAGGRGVSFKGSLQIGVMDLPTKISDLFGAPGSMAMDIYYMGKSFQKDDYLKGIEKFPLLPNAVGSTIKAYRESAQGITTVSNEPVFYGKKQLEPDFWDSVYRFFSFNPASIAGPREKLWSDRKIEQKYNEMKHVIYAKHKAFFGLPRDKRSRAKWVDLQLEVKKFNERIKRRGLYRIVSPITNKTIKANMKRAFRPPKKERLRKTP